MKRSFLVLIFILITAGVASAEAFVFIYNAETGDGFVYTSTSQQGNVLLVFYPTFNKVFSYSVRGQELYFADDMLKFFLQYGIEIDASTRSYIKRYPGRTIISPLDPRFK